MAYESVTGTLGPERFDILHAVLLSLIHNQWAKKPKKPMDFLPEWDQKKVQSPEDMLEMLKSWTLVSGGQIKEEPNVDDR